MEAEPDRELEQAQAALLARFAPETRVRRIRWSQGETQVFELGAGRRFCTSTVGWAAPTSWCRSLRLSRRTTASSPSTGRVTGWPIRSTTAASTCSTTVERFCGTSWTARASDGRRGRQLAGRVPVRRLRARRSQPRVAPCARRRAVRDRAKAAPPDASARIPTHRPAARQVPLFECDAGRRAGSSGGSSSSSIPSESTTGYSTSTSRTRDETSRACSA